MEGHAPSCGQTSSAATLPAEPQPSMSAKAQAGAPARARRGWKIAGRVRVRSWA